MKEGDHMRVCLLTLEWPPYGGGIGTYMFNLARGLAQMGQQVTVVTHDRNPMAVADVDIVSVPLPHEWGRVWRRLTPWRLEPFHTWSARAYRMYRRISDEKKFDIVETAEYGAWGRHLTHDRPVPLVVKCHTPTHVLWTINNGNEHHRKRPVWVRALDRHERQQAANADTIVSPSSALANYLSMDWGIPRTRFEVVPNPIDCEAFCPAMEEPIGNEILYVGRLDYNKGCFDLATAAVPLLEKYQHIRLRFVGMDMKSPAVYRDHGDLASDVIRRTVPQKFHSRLLFTEQVPVSEVVTFHRQAICAVVPTRGFESFSYTVLEPMASGCPVVATECGGPAEILTNDSDGLLVARGDTAGLATAIERLITDEPLRRRLAASARMTVERQYSIAAVVPQVIALYEKTIHGCSGRMWHN
jgi:glycosyltransferase involved in cell wall biosynthesis